MSGAFVVGIQLCDVDVIITAAALKPVERNRIDIKGLYRRRCCDQNDQTPGEGNSRASTLRVHPRIRGIHEHILIVVRDQPHICDLGVQGV
jgi:hypothetical protein